MAKFQIFFQFLAIFCFEEKGIFDRMLFFGKILPSGKNSPPKKIIVMLN